MESLSDKKMSVNKLPENTVKLITSSQVITSISFAVKELLENALDAGATSIDVKLINYGLDLLEVSDNGTGIQQTDINFAAMPHYTSKISCFEDLETLQTYGFRGEALNSLCRVGNVSISTATKSDSVRTIYTLNSEGMIVNSKPTHGVIGTTVTVSDLFKNLPVRRQNLRVERRAKEELKQTEMTIKSLAVIKPGIQLTFSHNKCSLWKKTRATNIKTSFSQGIGYPSCKDMEHIIVNKSEILLEMVIPKKDCDITSLCKSTPSWSLVYVNQRPVVYKKVSKILHEQVVSFFCNCDLTRKHVMSLISISIPPVKVDANLEPNKTRVLLQDEDNILKEIKTTLTEYYRPSLPVNSLENARDTDNDLDVEPTLKRRKLNENQLECVSSISRLSTHNNEKKNMDENPVKLNEMEAFQDENNIGLGQNNSQDMHNLAEKSKTALSENHFRKANYSEVLAEDASNINDLDEDFSELVSNLSNLISSTPMEKNLAPNPTNESSSINANSVTSKTPEADNPNNQISSQAWSMGHLKNPGGQPIEGSCVVINGVKPNMNAILEVNHGNAGCFQKSSGEKEKEPKHSTMESEAKGKVCMESEGATGEENDYSQSANSPRKIAQSVSTASGASNEANTTFQRGSDGQMSCREKAAFSKFASKVRPQLILDNPGIAFASIGMMLADRWKNLSLEEKKRYENTSKESCSTRKICQTNLSQSKLNWVQGVSSKNNSSDASPVSTEKLSQPEKRVANFVGRPPELQKSLQISNEIIKLRCSKFVQSKKALPIDSNGKLKLIGQLQLSGEWVCISPNYEVNFLNHNRLQEVVVNHKLLDTHTVLSAELVSPKFLTRLNLGEVAFETLKSLKRGFDELRNCATVSADIIKKNGFRLEIRNDESFLLSHGPKSLNYCGEEDLKEILHLYARQPNARLADCRPQKIVAFLKEETMRICRKSASSLDKAVLEEYLEYWSTQVRGDNQCLHHKPILYPVFNINTKKQVNSNFSFENAS